MSLEYWFMLPVSVLIATIAMASEVEKVILGVGFVAVLILGRVIL